MLQQTQVHRVLLKYPGFLRQYPSFRLMASAERADVVRSWQGMGYNNRAVRLHTLAQKVVHDHGGKLPDSYESLLALPGIGKYTAHALLSSAFGRRVAIVDVNVQRCLSRVFSRMSNSAEKLPEGAVWDMATTVLPHSRTYEWNQALMDLGALICTARRPLCDACPVNTQCASRNTMTRNAGHARKKEPMVDGFPSRIYRGWIVDRLRQRTHRGGIPQGQLGRIIRPGFSERDRNWLELLIGGLEKDGLVKTCGNGSWKTRHVMLA